MDRLYRYLNQIWLHGSPEQKEELRQVMLGLAEAVDLFTPLQNPSEIPTIHTYYDCLTALNQRWTPDLRDLLTEWLDEQVREIATARHRDITLI